MRFVYDLTVPAGTTEAEPETLDVRLTKGTLTGIAVAFPPGPAGLVSVVVYDHALQIAPANPEKAFAWDWEVHSFEMRYELSEPGHELTIKGWSPNCIYEHTIRFHFDVSAPGELLENDILEEFVRSLAAPGRA